jgi:hypothetical protein
MALLTLPATMPIKRITWTLRQPHQVNRSGWTGRRQVLTTPGGSLWTCSVEFVPIIQQANAKKWIGFFHSAEGQAHRFPVVAVEADQHSGFNPTVTAGAAGAFTATLSANVAALGLGDRATFKLSDGSYQLVTLTGPMSGATISFTPALRASAATGTGSIETIRPFAIVALAEDNWTYSVDAGQQYAFAFTAEEAF